MMLARAPALLVGAREEIGALAKELARERTEPIDKARIPRGPLRVRFRDDAVQLGVEVFEGSTKSSVRSLRQRAGRDIVVAARAERVLTQEIVARGGAPVRRQRASRRAVEHALRHPWQRRPFTTPSAANAEAMRHGHEVLRGDLFEQEVTPTELGDATYVGPVQVGRADAAAVWTVRALGAQA